MAQDITIAGATFNGVPSIMVPTAGGGQAVFADPSDTTATAADVAQGKTFLTALGAYDTGTASASMSDEAKAAVIDALRHIDYPIDEANDVYRHLEELLSLGIVTVDPDGSVTVTDAKGGEPVCLKLHLAPTQDLHGYPYPWTEGNGKNKCLKYNYISRNGVTLTVNSDGTFKASGTASGTFFYNPGSFTIEKDVVYYGSGAPAIASGTGFTLRDSAGGVTNDNGIMFGTCDFYTTDVGRVASAANNYGVQFTTRIGSGVSLPSTTLWYPMLALIGRNNHMAGKLSTGSEGGLTFTQNEYGVFVVNGTCTDPVYFGATITLPAGDYTVAGNRVTRLRLYDSLENLTPMSEVEGFTGTDNFGERGGDFSLDREMTMWCGFAFAAGTYTDKKVYPVVCDLVEPNYTAYAPYAANICPFTRTVGSSVSLNHGADMTTYSTESISIPSYTSFYGGYVDFVNRSLVRYTRYASYAGEPLRGEWLSSKDRYLPGATPTTGAEVIDMELVTQLATTVSPVTLLAGNNAVWSSDGDIVLTYEAAEET